MSNKKYLDLTGVKNLINNVFSKFVTKTEHAKEIDGLGNNIDRVNDKADTANDWCQTIEDRITDYYSTTVKMNDAITQAVSAESNSIKLQVSATYATKNDFNDLQIGGRNLILGGKGDTRNGFFKYFNKVENGYGEHTLTSKKQYASVYVKPGFLLGCRDYEVGTSVTISYDFMYTKWDFPKGSVVDELWFGQRYSNSSVSGASGQWRDVTRHTLPRVGTDCELNEWIHVTKTFKIPAQADASVDEQALILFYNSNADVSASITFRIKNLKLEKGNKATDWTPAPEDIDSAIETVNTTLIKSLSASGKVITYTKGDGTTGTITTQDTNTTNTTGSTNTSSKIFLVGATSQASAPVTYSHDTAYVGTDGCLYSNSTRVVSEVRQSTEPTTQKAGDYWIIEG